MATHVREVMTDHPRTLPSSAPLCDAAREMRDSDIGSVIVMEGGSICGIVTDRDIVVRAVARGMNPVETPLSAVCTREPVTLSPEQEIDEAVALMRMRGIRRLPVEEDGRPVGIVSLGDLAIERDQRSVLGEISARPASR
jgi:signal-transduction protein with cAMP-binding, CBS, and nucleotidyltransferase domain